MKFFYFLFSSSVRRFSAPRLPCSPAQDKAESSTPWLRLDRVNWVCSKTIGQTTWLVTSCELPDATCKRRAGTRFVFYTVYHIPPPPTHTHSPWHELSTICLLIRLIFRVNYLWVYSRAEWVLCVFQLFLSFESNVNRTRIRFDSPSAKSNAFNQSINQSIEIRVGALDPAIA